MDTSEPYTGEMRGTMHEPQVNLGADQKFSPSRLKTRKGGLNIPNTSLSFATPFEPKHICFLKTTKKIAKAK